MTDYALTLHRPWPWCIFHLDGSIAKPIENRNWKPPPKLIGQRIAIHAGDKYDRESSRRIATSLAIKQDIAHHYGLPPRALDKGIIGTARVVGVVAEGRHGLTLVSGSWGSVSPRQARTWFVGKYGWLLDEIRTLSNPIPDKGRQKLWRIHPDISQAINEEEQRSVQATIQ